VSGAVERNGEKAAGDDGGTKLSRNLRAGATKATGEWRALCGPCEQEPAANATSAAESQMVSQLPQNWRAAVNAAATAVTPMANPPHPGTAVNEPARSMVSRM
jgi:hypothetical protein